MAARKPNKHHTLLLITEHNDELEQTNRALRAAGYGEDQVITEDAERAMDYLCGRGGFEESRPPSLIMVDLDHTEEEGRKQLGAVVEDLKSHEHFRLIPVLLLLRERDPDYVLSWYRAGIHACVFRPDSFEAMTQMFERVRDYWSTKVILPELE